MYRTRRFLNRAGIFNRRFISFGEDLIDPWLDKEDADEEEPHQHKFRGVITYCYRSLQFYRLQRFRREIKSVKSACHRQEVKWDDHEDPRKRCWRWRRCFDVVKGDEEEDPRGNKDQDQVCHWIEESEIESFDLHVTAGR